LGKRLAAGRMIDNPTIVWAGSRPFVLFSAGETRPELRAVPFDGEGPVQAVTQGFPCWSEVQMSSSGHVVVDTCYGTIAVFDLESGTVVRSITGSFDQLQGDTLLFKQTFFGTDYSFLTRIPDGIEQSLGNISQAWFAPSGRLYYLLYGSLLGAVDAPGATPKIFNGLVKEFVISPDEGTAVVSDLQGSGSDPPSPAVFRVLELPSYRELMTLPLDEPYCTSCPWPGFSPDSRHFFYAENFQQGPSALHQYEVQGNQILSTRARPGPFLDDLLWSQSGDLALIGESVCEPGSYPAKCQDLFRLTLGLGPVVEPISTAVARAAFSADSSHLLFLDALESGRLLLSSIDSVSPDPAAQATVLSPSGSLVDGSSFDSATGTAVFWATPNGGRSWMLLSGGYERASLYAAPAPAFQVRRLAEEVDAVAVGPGLVLASVHFSPQNQTGDLALYDLRSGHERTLASPVSSFWVTPACPNPASLSLNAKWKPGWGMVGGTSSMEIVVPPGCPADSPLLVTFTVRGPIASDKDGLWAITVQP
jgi:hypothetical protein